ncbi:MAG: hypothetical protein AAFN27_16450 [Pseudomonadota bacterium]
MKDNYDKGDLIEFQASEHCGDDLSATSEDADAAEHPAKPRTWMRLPAYVMSA